MDDEVISISLKKEQWRRIIESWYYAEGEGAPPCEFEDILRLQEAIGYKDGDTLCKDCGKRIEHGFSKCYVCETESKNPKCVSCGLEISEKEIENGECEVINENSYSHKLCQGRCF